VVVWQTTYGSPVRPDQDIAWCAAAQQRLHETIASLTDDDVRRPSLLPGWTIGHVLTHVARNADSHVRLLDGARRREPVFQYGPDQREREIEEGATRDATSIIADVRGAAAALEAAWAATSDDVWATGLSRFRDTTLPITQQVVRRWREVEFHHADLGLGFTYADFSPEYTRRELEGASPPPFAGRDPNGG
jgi:maleylpyruvate isomerase